MADASRAQRLADRIKVIVAEALEKRVKDPRLGFVTVTDVRLTGDLREATVFYTVLGDDESVQQTAQALASVTGMLRSHVGKLIGIKFTPTLTFIADALPQSAQTIEHLLAQARAVDEHVHGLAAHAQYAGEADPYRHDDEDEDETEAEAEGQAERHAEGSAEGSGNV